MSSSSASCEYCGLNQRRFSNSQGGLARHQQLCLGLDIDGRSLGIPDRCLICGTVFKAATTNANVSHYRRLHDEHVNVNRTIRHLQRDYQSHLFPDLNLNNDYGSYLTSKNVLIMEEDLARWGNLWAIQPMNLERESRVILYQYQADFETYFKGVMPLSYHGHVSDVNNPFFIASLIRHIIQYGPNPRRLTKAQIDTPCVAVLEGTYGSGFGPQAYVSVVSGWSNIACGPKPFTIAANGSQATTEKHLIDAKAAGCVALIVEIVRSRDGRVLHASEWKTLAEKCAQVQLFLIVDESLTSIRCGAPFAYQRPEYSDTGFHPDLVFFGKGLRVSGVAVDWQGVNTESLNINSSDKRSNVFMHWQKLFTRSTSTADLLQAIGTIRLAQRELWHERSVEIGRLLREIAFELCPSLKQHHVAGLDALIYLRRKEVQSTNVIPAGAGGKLVRWIPTMDEVISSKEDLLQKVFDIGSKLHRQQLAIYLRDNDWMPLWCANCGEPANASELCPSCAVIFCEACQPKGHVCIDKMEQ